MKQVYISHTWADRRYMEALREYLQRGGYSVRTNRALGQGADWELAVVDTIPKVDVLIPLLTEKGVESVAVTYEWALAMGAGVPVLPVVFLGVNPHPHVIILPHYTFGSQGNDDDDWQQFMRTLQRFMGDPVTVVEAKRERPTLALNALEPAPKEPAPKEPAAQHPGGFYLEIVVGDQPVREERLTGKSISVGREDSNDIQINNIGVSRTHLRFIRTDGGYQAMDMGSTNGTFKGQERITLTNLRPGDVLKLGPDVTITFIYES